MSFSPNAVRTGLSKGGSGGSSTDLTAQSTENYAKAAVDAITAQAGESIPAGTELFGASRIWKNGTAAAITVPATITVANMESAGFTPAGGSVTVNEVVLSNSDLTGKAAAGAKYGRNVVSGAEFYVNASGDWATAPLQSPLQTTVRASASAVDTAVPSERAVRALFDSMASPTQKLASGGTPAAGGVYVQAIGDTHVVPTLLSGQRCVVIQLQTGGGSIETTYLHDGTSQVTSSVQTTAAASAGAVADVTGKTTATHTWSGEVFSDSIAAWAASVRKHFGSTEKLDFNTVHLPAAGKAPLYNYSWSSSTELTNTPDSSALGVTGHGYYTGDDQNGQQFVYFWRDAKQNTVEYLRERIGGVWLSWSIASADDWIASGSEYRYVSGQHVILQDGHNCNFLYSGSSRRPIRLIPATTWDKVGSLTVAQADWSFSQGFPSSGNEEVLLIPDETAKKFLLSKAPAAAAPADASTTAKGIVQLADAAAITAGTAGRVVDAAHFKSTIETVDSYFGYFTNQAGNTGHQFTQGYCVGSNITTSDNITFTLAKGRYRVIFTSGKNYGLNSWRTIGLQVDGAVVTSTYQGHDGSNWEGSGALSWTVDAASASHTIRIYRTSSNGNGNGDGYLHIDRIPASNLFMAPEGSTVRTPCTVIINGGASQTLFGGTAARLMATPGAGNMVSTAVGSAGLTVSVADPLTGALEVSVAEGTTSGTITTTTIAQTRLRPLLTTANAGTAVVFGTIAVQIAPSGNRSVQIRSNTGSNISLTIHNLWSDGGAGAGLVNMTATTTMAHVNNSWNFGTQGQHQTLVINDTTNNRCYSVVAEIGGSYLNNSFSCVEL